MILIQFWFVMREAASIRELYSTHVLGVIII